MLLYQLIVLGVLLLIALNCCLNILVFRRPKSAPIPDAGEAPLISILIPARNEENRLGPCLDSLFRQSYPDLEWIVMDDHSTDATADLVRARMAGEPRLRLAQSETLPQGWTGKAWACWQLSQKARGEILLFTDADTHHELNSVADAAAMLRQKKGDLLSLWPRQIAKTWSEILILPFVHVLILFYLPHWMPRFVKSRSLGVANGQFMMFTRGGYDAIGGHQKVHSHLVEDVALGREIKTSGLRLLNADGSRHVSCRMYENFSQVWEGFTKNLRAGFEDNVAGFVFMGLVQFIFLTGPFFCLDPEILGFSPRVLPVVLAQITLILALRIALALLYRQPLIGALLHPVGQMLALIIALNSWIQSARGRVTWKGRSYKP